MGEPVRQAGRQQIENPRYNRLQTCATPEASEETAGQTLRAHVLAGFVGSGADQQGQITCEGKGDKESKNVPAPQECASGKDDGT
jgi:hypothetical protein